MYQAINAVYQQGTIIPLEPMALNENEAVIVLRLQPMPSFAVMPRKTEEKPIEDEKWPK